MNIKTQSDELLFCVFLLFLFSLRRYTLVELTSFISAGWVNSTAGQEAACLSVCLCVNQGPDFQIILGKILGFAQVFPKFMLSLSKVIKLRFHRILNLVHYCNIKTY